ncbi:MAG: (d)CMP kinase [Candidatus Sericytochromatia bacterium]
MTPDLAPFHPPVLTPVIALDGHAGAGKSTVAGEVARRLGFWHVNTGLFYRAVTWKALSAHYDLGNQASVEALAQAIQIVVKEDAEGQQHVWVNGQEITSEIRTPEINQQISLISSFAGVRDAITRQLRQIQHPRGIIMDGRDIGTVVFPDAQLKIFLTASVEERARRQLQDVLAQGQNSTLEELQTAIARRDKLDSERTVAPLKQAPDAIRVDSTGLAPGQVIDQILTLWTQRQPATHAQPQSKTRS